MYKNNTGTIIWSATDLADHIACTHLTGLNLSAALGETKRPYRNDPFLTTLRERGVRFEEQYLAELEASGLEVVKIDRDDPNAAQTTIAAMRKGVDVIYQGRLESGNFAGWSDFLRKAPFETALGSHGYEVTDTKISSETRAGALLQIAVYSEVVGEIQGKMPEAMHIRKPGATETYRLEDFIHYTRYVKDKLAAAISNPAVTYPEPVSHCEICNWFKQCNAKRRSDDHLGFVAGMGTAQTREMQSQAVATMKEFADWAVPDGFRPSRGNPLTYGKLRKQAELQVEAREHQTLPIHFIAGVEPEKGFGMMPEPNADDVFLDFEGDPLVEPSGREYLLGYIHQGLYTGLWSYSEAAEKSNFEAFIDFAVGLAGRNAGFHIYHYGAYEEAALKRLASRHATRQEELDQLLRTGKFVDLYLVVRQSIQLGIERYSLKHLEPYHGFIREADLESLSPVKNGFEKLLQEGNAVEAPDEMREMVRQYNEDDCRSTLALQAWLEAIRPAGLERLPLPEVQEPEEDEAARLELIREQYQTLMENVPEDTNVWNPGHKAQFILANFLDWYRREKKNFWWEYFRLNKLTAYELIDEPKALAGLVYSGAEYREQLKTRYIDRYSFPPQEHDIRRGMKVRSAEVNGLGEVHKVDNVEGLVWILKTKKYTDVHPEAIMEFNLIKDDVKQEAIMEIAEWVAGQEGDGLLSEGPEYRSSRDLLLGNPPRFSSAVNLTGDLSEIALALDRSILPVQGPPGSGKSWQASRMIVELVRKGKKVGITALSHKVINELLDKIHTEAAARGVNVVITQKVSTLADDCKWNQVTDNPDAREAVNGSNVIAGTPFMWCRPEFIGTLDYLVIDEAGQLSLIDTIAASGAAANLVMLGDPQQLQQPQQGSHPEGTGTSALEHLLAGRQTLGEGQGVFLGTTWRMEPSICRYVSDMFYESRLLPVTGLENQLLEGDTRFTGQGLVFVPTVHTGRTNRAEEEVNSIAAIINELTQPGVYYRDKEGNRHQMTTANIKVIAPFNAQVESLKERLPGMAIGTVDLFQGQQAEVVIYSVTSSSAEDAPRGMEFLYAPDRLNVAVSRAKAMFIMVGAPKIFEVACKSPAQIRLANPWCRFIRDARAINL